MMRLEAAEFAQYFAEAGAKFPGRVARVVARCAKVALDAARKRAHANVAKLLDVEIFSDGFGLVSDHKASRFIESGTAAHIIEPSRARVLAFTVGGDRIFAKRVNHPGTEAKPFMAPAMRLAEIEFMRIGPSTVFKE